MRRPRRLDKESVRASGAVGSGLTIDMIAEGAARTYATLDTIDEQLLKSESPRLANVVELANLSSILGNLFAGGIVAASDGVFERAGPHKYQDLRASSKNPSAEHIEIKVALETNKPKGHLAKPGPYLTCRYVLADQAGRYTPGVRGEVVWIWEIRFGHLQEEHFNLSNTPGDSGKTAVVNRGGMDQLRVVYADRERSPYGDQSKYWTRLQEDPSPADPE